MKKLRHDIIKAAWSVWAIPVWCASVLMIISCTEAAVIRCTIVGAEGYLKIYPDNTEYTLPAMEYHFYNMDGQTECLSLPCDGVGNFEGNIPTGTYKVVANNSDAGGVVFSGMENYETATVCVLPYVDAQVTRTTQTTLLQQPEKVYSVTVDDFDVVPEEVLEHTPVPSLLNKYVRINFTLSEELQARVVGLEGVLQGIYTTVHLFSCEPIDENNPLDYGIHFTAQEYDGYWETTSGIFGICNPQYGESYTNILEIWLTLTDGRVIEVESDLTTQLSEIIHQNGGTIPITLTLELVLESTEAGVIVEILPWDSDGSFDIELY